MPCREARLSPFSTKLRPTQGAALRHSSVKIRIARAKRAPAFWLLDSGFWILIQPREARTGILDSGFWLLLLLLLFLTDFLIP